MGKNHSIYLDDESDELIGNVEGKGTIINKLIKEYFLNTDEDYLRRLIENKQQELEFYKKKLDKLITRRTHDNIVKELSKEEKAEKEKRALISDTLLKMWRDEKLNDKQYYGCFGSDGKIIIEKAEKLINGEQGQGMF